MDIIRDSWQAQERFPKVSSRPPFPYFHSHPYRVGDQLLRKATKRVCADKPEKNYEWTFNSIIIIMSRLIMLIVHIKHVELHLSTSAPWPAERTY